MPGARAVLDAVLRLRPVVLRQRPAVWATCGALVLPWGSALAQVTTAEQHYRAKCSICHDSGAGNAPRLAQSADWTARVVRGRASLYARTIAGVPNSPMAAKGGFADLTDAETRALVDYMLLASGHANTPMQPAPSSAAAGARAGAGGGAVAGSAADQGSGSGSTTARAAAPATPLTDQSITASVAARLRAQLGKPDMLLDLYEGVITVRGIGVKVETRDGITTLSGVLHDAALIGRAEQITAAMPGVKQVINRMISGGMLDFD